MNGRLNTKVDKNAVRTCIHT